VIVGRLVQDGHDQRALSSRWSLKTRRRRSAAVRAPKNVPPTVSIVPHPTALEAERTSISLDPGVKDATIQPLAFGAANRLAALATRHEI